MLARLFLFLFGRKVVYDRLRVSICFGLDDGGVLNIIRRKCDTAVILVDTWDNTVSITDDWTLARLAREHVPEGEPLTLYYREYRRHALSVTEAVA